MKEWILKYKRTLELQNVKGSVNWKLIAEIERLEKKHAGDWEDFDIECGRLNKVIERLEKGWQKESENTNWLLKERNQLLAIVEKTKEYLQAQGDFLNTQSQETHDKWKRIEKELQQAIAELESSGDETVDSKDDTRKGEHLLWEAMQDKEKK